MLSFANLMIHDFWQFEIQQLYRWTKNLTLLGMMLRSANGKSRRWEPSWCVCDLWPFAHTRTPCTATRCNAMQRRPGASGRAAARRARQRSPRGPGGALGHRARTAKPIARTSPRATCKLVPTAKMLSLARDTPAYVSSPTGFTLKLVSVAASMSHEREFNWTIISKRDCMQVKANTVIAYLKYDFCNKFIPKQCFNATCMRI